MAVAELIDIGKRRTVVEDIAQGLIRYIATHRLKGGDRLPSERELVRMVGASRLPLREALCVLKGLGIVEARHGKGVFVKPLDLAAVFSVLSPLLRTQSSIEVNHLFEARLHLEGSIVELAAAHRSEENLARLEESLLGMRDNLAERQPYIQHDMAFHQELARSTGNPIFHVFMASITDLLSELQFLYKDDLDVRRAAVGEHEQILTAVRERDAARARAAMLRHLENATGRM